jgi:quercetin 2,3-dioxygenase
MVAKVISGEVFGVKGPIVARTPTYFIDFIFAKAETVYEHVIPKGWNSMFIIYKGKSKVQTASKVLEAVTCVPFLTSDSDQIVRLETQEADTRVVLLAGEPLNEPIANYGPFVLTTQEQLQQAFDDYHAAKNGFENARKWKSEIQNLKFGRSRSL